MRPAFHFLLITLTLSFVSGCSNTTLLTRQDYAKSRSYLADGRTDDAVLGFPRQFERGDFITTMEKTYLNLLQGKPQIKALKAQVDILEDRVRYHISREAKTFFYLQTPEDYYASEHEVIWMHFLLGWGYALQGEYESACVEARVAGSLLTLPWSAQGNFDDPMLRIFLGTLWTMCGEWQEAQVDFRAAWELDHTLVWARELAMRATPPANLILVLGGTGPEVKWTPELDINPLRSERQVSFEFQGRKSRLMIRDHAGYQLNTFLSPDATPWYVRHLERESELHELILDSAFGGKATASGVVAGGKIAAHTGLGILVGVGGTALGAVIANAGLQSSSEEVFRLGLITIAASLAYGGDIISDGYRSSVKAFKQDMDPSLQYRYVRFLPEYLWLGWTDNPLEMPLQLDASSGMQGKIEQAAVRNKSTVSLGYMPDTTRVFSFTR